MTAPVTAAPEALSVAEVLSEIAEHERRAREYDAKRVVGQFTVEPGPGGWMARAYEGGPGNSMQFYAATEAECVARVGEACDRGGVQMNAVPCSQYHADVHRERAAALREAVAIAKALGK